MKQSRVTEIVYNFVAMQNFNCDILIFVFCGAKNQCSLYEMCILMLKAHTYILSYVFFLYLFILSKEYIEIEEHFVYFRILYMLFMISIMKVSVRSKYFLSYNFCIHAVLFLPNCYITEESCYFPLLQ